VPASSAPLSDAFVTSPLDHVVRVLLPQPPQTASAAPGVLVTLLLFVCFRVPSYVATGLCRRRVSRVRRRCLPQRATATSSVVCCALRLPHLSLCALPASPTSLSLRCRVFLVLLPC
jgi:hypothetical protein